MKYACILNWKMIFFPLLFSLIVVGVVGNFTVSEVTSYCSSYKASKTNSATSYYCTCSLDLCPGQSVSIDSCAKCDGVQYFKLVDSAGNMVSSTESFNSTCYPCGEIQNYAPQISICEKFSIRQGCYLQNTCSGKVRVRIYNSSEISTAASSQILQSLYVSIDSIENRNSSRILRTSSGGSSRSSSSSSTGYCNRDEGLSVGAIIAAILIPLLCCGFCFAVVFQLVNKCHSREKVTPSNQMFIASSNYNVAPVVAVPAGNPTYVHVQTQSAAYSASVSNSAPISYATPVAVPVYSI